MVYVLTRYVLRNNGMHFIPVNSILRGRETLEEAGKAPNVVVVSTLGGTGRWKVVVEGNERVQQGASDKYGMEVGSVLESRESVEG